MIGFHANSHVYHKEHNGRRNFINRGKEMTADTYKESNVARGDPRKISPIRLLQPFSVQGIALFPRISNAYRSMNIRGDSRVKIYCFKQFYFSLVWNEFPAKNFKWLNCPGNKMK